MSKIRLADRPTRVGRVGLARPTTIGVAGAVDGKPEGVAGAGDIDAGTRVDPAEP